jgi:hypothetical protein
MSREQGPHLWGCERPRMLPGIRHTARYDSPLVTEEAS